MTADNDADALAGLDFTVQCACTLCGQHKGRRCEQPAEFTCTVHAFGNCKAPGLAEGGFALDVACSYCTYRRKQKVVGIVKSSLELHRRTSRYLVCSGCHTPITAVDELWEAKALDV